MSSAIVDKVASAQKRCTDVLDQLSQPSTDNGGALVSISRNDVRDFAARLKLWAGTTGASQPPRSALSLESRLQEAPEVLEEVSSLLDEILEALDELYAIASGAQENRTLVPFSQADTSSELYEIDISDVGDGTSPRGELRTEDQDILGIMGDCVTSLFDISILIQKATPRDRFTIAIKQTPFFMEQFDINYVQERYPKLSQPDKSWLLERLGRSITHRRQYLRYCREHRERLEQPKSLAIGPSDVPKDRISPAQSHEPVNMLEHKDPIITAPPQALSTSASHTIQPSTKASTLDKARLEEITEGLLTGDANDDDDGATAYSSAASLVSPDQSEARLRPPSLNDVKNGGREFDCPFCRKVVRMTRERAWKRHVYSDIKAYVCTMGKGMCNSTQMFADQTTWFEHELQNHRQQWICPVCRKGPFESAGQFQSHMSSRHRELAEAQVSALTGVSKSLPTAIPARDCPFCDEWEATLRRSLQGGTAVTPGNVDVIETVVTVEPSQFRRHVGAHLQQLALFAIFRGPWANENEDSQIGTAGSNDAHAEHANQIPAVSFKSALTSPSTPTSASQKPDDPAHAMDPDSLVRGDMPDRAPILSAPRAHLLTNKIHDACRAGALEDVRKLLVEDPTNLEAVDESHQTPLILAAHLGQTDIVRVLLEYGAKIEAKDKWDRTPLISAAGQGHERVVEMLLSLGADTDAMDSTNRTPLMWAGEEGHASIMELLLNETAKEPSIRLIPWLDADAPFDFEPITRFLRPGGEAIIVRRFSETQGDTDAHPGGSHERSGVIGFKSKAVSRRPHCVFIYKPEPQRWFLQDVGSSSGTFLNDDRLSPLGIVSGQVPLKDGDLIQLGGDSEEVREVPQRSVVFTVEVKRRKLPMEDPVALAAHLVGTNA